MSPIQRSTVQHKQALGNHQYTVAVEPPRPVHLCVFADPFLRVSGSDLLSRQDRFSRPDRISSLKAGRSDPAVDVPQHCRFANRVKDLTSWHKIFPTLIFQMQHDCNIKFTIKMLTIWPHRKMFIGGLNWETTDRKSPHVLTCLHALLNIPRRTRHLLMASIMQNL